MTSSRLVVAALMGATVLMGCSVDREDLDAIERLPGVEDADAFCEIGHCRVTVDVSAGISAEQFGTVVDEAGSIGSAEEITVIDRSTPGIELTFDTDVDVDGGRVAELLIDARDSPGEVRSELSISRRQARWSEQVASDRETDLTDALNAARARWGKIKALKHLAMTFRAGRPDGPADRLELTATGEFPDGAVDAVIALDDTQARPLILGARVTGDGVILAGRTLDHVERLESAADQEASFAEVDTSVVVSSSVIRMPDDVVERDRDVRALLAALDVQGQVDLIGRVIEIEAPSTGLDAVADAIDRAREADPAASRSVGFTVAGENRRELLVELFGQGSADLVRLADRLQALPLGGLEIEGIDPEFKRRSGQPPADTEGIVVVTVRADSLDEAVAKVAQRFTGFEAQETSLSLHLTAVDGEGRSPRVSIRVDRRGDEWVASTLDRGLPETVDTAIAAWTAATR